MKYDAPYINDENIPERELSDDYMPDRTEIEPMRCSVFNKQCDTCKYNSKNDCKMYKNCEYCPNQINDSCNCLCRPFVNERNCMYYKEYKQDDNDND